MIDKKRMLNTERGHLFTPNVNIVMRVIITGKPDVMLLKQAIEIAVKANESLQCKITLQENGEAVYEIMVNPVYHIKISDKNWKEIKSEQEYKIFNLKDGELVRFFIITSGDEVELLTIAHHLAGDGLSIVFLIEDIMTALSGNKLKYKPLQLIQECDLPKKSELNLAIKYLLQRLNSKWLKSGKVFSYNDYKMMFNKYWNTRKTTMLIETFSKNEIKLLCKKAKQYKISLNSLITTAFICAYKEKAQTQLAVSVRDKTYRGMSNQASGISIKYKYNDNLNFFQNAKAVHKRIYKKLNNDKKKFMVLQFINIMESTFIDSPCMNIYGEYKNKHAEKLAHLMRYANNQRDISMTNLARLDIPQKYGKYSLKNFVFIPPIVPTTRGVIGMATLGDELCILINLIEDDTANQKKEFFMDAIQFLKDINR